MKKFLVLSILMFSFLFVNEVMAVDGCYCKIDNSEEKILIPGVTQETCIEYGTQSVTFNDQELTECEYNVSGEAELVESVKEAENLEVPEGLKDLNKLGTTSVQTLIGRFLHVIIGSIGTIALVMFIYGGILWMISGGSAEKTKKSLDIMLWAGLGSLVVLASYAILNYIFELL